MASKVTSVDYVRSEWHHETCYRDASRVLRSVHGVVVISNVISTLVLVDLVVLDDDLDITRPQWKPPKLPAMPELSSYEQQRLENIKRNEALMRELNLLNGASALGIDPETTRRARAAAAAAASSSAASSASTSGRSKPKLTAAEAKARKQAAEQRKRERREAASSTLPTRVQPPRRSSARLAGAEAESEVRKRAYEEALEVERQEREAAKRARHEDHDLRRLTGGGLSEQEVRALRAAFSGLGSEGVSSRRADADADEADGADETMRTPRKASRSSAKAAQPALSKQSTQELDELRKELDKMELRAVAKTVRSRIYSLAYHPTTEKDLIFVGDKEGSIGVWEPWAASEADGDDDNDDEEGEGDGDASMPSGKSWALQAHGKDAVTCLKFDPVDARTLYSSSYDCTLRALSLDAAADAAGSTEVWAGTPDVLLSVFDVLAPSIHAEAFTRTPAPGLEERSLWIADHRGGLIHLDLRERPRFGGRTHASPAVSNTRGGRGARAGHQGSSAGATSRRWQVHEKKIGGMSVNDALPYAIATAGLDQHVRLFDVRALDSMPVTMEPPYHASAVDGDVLAEVQGGAQRASSRAPLACTSVDWSPRGDQLAALSYDNVIKLWDIDGDDLRSGFDEEGTAPSLNTQTSTTSPPASSERRSRRGGAGGGGGGSGGVKKEDAGVFSFFPHEPTMDEKGAPSLSKVDKKPSSSSASARTKTTGTLLSRLGSRNVLEHPSHTLPHNNQTGKWLTMFRAKWTANAAASPHFSLGSMHRHAEIWSGTSGAVLRSLYEEAWVTAVPAVTAMHPRVVGRLVAGHASGRCHLWCPP